MTPIRSGGIIAAGEGSRLRAVGRSKPLVPVGGVPLIARVLGNFAAAGITGATVIVNGDEEDCAAFVRERFANLVTSVIVRTTASSLESFLVILATAPPGRLLVSTVDAVCPRPDFVAFAQAAAACPTDACVLAVTTFVDDEKPLWVRTDPDGGVRAVGGPGGDAVTAGIYVVPARLRTVTPPPGLGRLRDYLAWLCDAGVAVRAIPMRTVIDVDRPEDLAAAEALLREAGSGDGA